MTRPHAQYLPTALDQARGLSSGTLSRLIGSTKYDDIDRAHEAFIVWLMARPSDEFETWRSAWIAYRGLNNED